MVNPLHTSGATYRYYWVLVVVVVVVPVFEPSPPPVAAVATPTAELTVLTLVAEELPAETDAAADPAASPPERGSIDRGRRKRRYSQQAIQYFFITISLHCMNGDLPKRISGEIEYTQPKVCKLRRAGI